MDVWITLNYTFFIYFSARATFNCSEISSIAHDKYQNNYINESYNTTSNSSIADAVPNNFSNSKSIN